MPAGTEWGEILQAVLEESARAQGRAEPGGCAGMAGLVTAEASRAEIAGPARALFGSPPLALVSFDADRIKEYVLGTARLAEIRGASAILRNELSEEGVARWLAGLPACFTIFAAGGSGLLALPAHLAEQACTLIEERFHQNTHGGTCSAVSLALWPEELVWGRHPAVPGWEGPFVRYYGPVPFGRLVAHLGSLLRRRKNEKLAGADFAPLPGVLLRCESCGLEAAAEEADDGDHLCSRCSRKREYGRQRSPEEAHSVNDIAGPEEGRTGRVGVIYLDANGMGAVFEQLADPMQFRAFSREATAVFSRAGHEVAQQLGFKRAKGQPGRYQAPVFGGDDLVMVLPAECTVRAVVMLMDFMAGEFDRVAGEHPELAAVCRQLTVSCGFVVAPGHFPMYLLFEYAEELLGSAKRLSYRTSGCPPAVDFLVLKDSSPLSHSLEEYRSTRYRPPLVAEGTVVLTRRPYLFADFREQVAAAVDRLREVPGSQLGLAAQALLQHPRAARLELAYQVLQEKEKWAPFLEKVMGPRDRWLEFFLEEADGRWVSRFLDIFELCEAGRR